MSFLLLAALGFAAPPSPQRVTVGAYVHDIQNLDLKSHSYAVDLYLWFRWKNPALDPASTFEFMNPFDAWGHVKTPVYEKPVRLPSGEYYQVVRNLGRFSRKLPLYDYPYDRQTLLVELEDSSRGSDELVFEPDAVTVNPALELPGFTVGIPRLTTPTVDYPTAFGDLREPRPPSFSRARIEIPIVRPMLPYTIKLLLPILCVVFCAALQLLFHPRHVDSRVGIGITALLTIVALQITLNDDLPETAYLVLMDKIYLGAYLYVIAGLAIVVATTWMLERKDTERAVRLDRAGLKALTAFYIVATASLIALAL